MKILPIDKVREGDAYTIKNEPIESINLMERAANACASWLEAHFINDRKIMIFCGLGNNGGDGLAIARLLHQKNYDIEVYIIRHSDKSSDDFNTNYERLKNIPEIKVIEISDEGRAISDSKSVVRKLRTTEGITLPDIKPEDIVIDALLGSGLTKPVKGFISKIINHINRANATVISVDVPSGLFCDESSESIECAVIKANYTLTFQLPKYAFMFSENDKYAGIWEVLDIGISREYLDNTEAKNFFIDNNDVRNIYKPREKFAHKGNYGHGLLISGSYGKMGAAVLGSMASLRTGIGLQTTHIPKCGYNIIQTAIPEAMVSIDSSDYYFTDIIDLSKYNAVAVGPGIGMEKETQQALKLLIQNSNLPIIFDADAINILGINKTWIPFIPKNSIFTPHPKEFERITTKAENDFHRNKLQREFSIKYNAYVVLKGAQTAITSPDGKCYFNSTGNPGMATAGSGDVLTGIILSLIAQNYKPLEACILGVYLHGLAGDIAGEEKGYEALIAGDIIMNLGNAFRRIKQLEIRNYLYSPLPLII